VTEQPQSPESQDPAAQEAGTEAWAPPTEAETRPHRDALEEATADTHVTQPPTEVAPTAGQPETAAVERPAAEPEPASVPEPVTAEPTAVEPGPEPVVAEPDPVPSAEPVVAEPEPVPPPELPPTPEPPPAAAEVPSSAVAAASERPEIPIGAAFAAGFVLALILRRLAR
jgi:hypothetical protein